ncbi:hypothetical protein CJ179_38475 [Rhodococcus sp. ACS1]|uniref:hypothetical protein n=1 Tax=Rhodococcus sp. ACS1 TaxID=2028570 RepID=UPI000BB0F55B|nr:hypothetical protein [Rhodococcus sp. ACS1]PBC38487.1 hypothetical protein CJ179_38475 [Rhodococcus sp. ACS1]
MTIKGTLAPIGSLILETPPLEELDSYDFAASVINGHLIPHLRADEFKIIPYEEGIVVSGLNLVVRTAFISDDPDQFEDQGPLAARVAVDHEPGVNPDYIANGLAELLDGVRDKTSDLTWGAGAFVDGGPGVRITVAGGSVRKTYELKIKEID